jgi:Xaa-Pro aminopeptidase
MRELVAGMVFPLVPGVSLPGRAEVVISETVAVTVDGIQGTTNFPPIFVV